jgi:hypothetical protein
MEQQQIHKKEFPLVAKTQAHPNETAFSSLKGRIGAFSAHAYRSLMTWGLRHGSLA